MPSSRGPALALLALLAFSPSPVTAQGANATSAVDLARQAGRLRPGQWVWAPEIAPAGPVTVYVDLSGQLATVYRNGVRIGVSTVSSGKPGHETPTGVFTILQKDAKHRSSTYNNAPMPYQQRLTWDGVALHAGGLPGYPESHGCVHLPLGFARLLFGTTNMGGTVIVAGRAGASMRTAAAGVLGPGGKAGHRPLGGNEPYRWAPAVSPTGPMTILVSRSDQRVVVLRNGVEIGRARAMLPGGDAETHVLTYTGAPNGESRWIGVGVPGHAGEAGKPLDPAFLSRLRLPAGFLDLLVKEIRPGTTTLITNAPVLPDTTGRSLTVLASAEPQANGL